MQVAAINATKVELLRCWPNVAALLAHASALKANSGADEISCYCKSALAILALSIRKRRHYSWWSLLRCLRFSDRAGFCDQARVVDVATLRVPRASRSLPI